MGGSLEISFGPQKVYTMPIEVATHLKCPNFVSGLICPIYTYSLIQINSIYTHGY